MFVYQTYNPVTEETNSITGKNVIESCASALNYDNSIEDKSGNEYTVKFYDTNSKIIIELSEAGLYYAITGNSIKENEENVSDEIKEESQKFWEMTHAKVKMIEFLNPVRMGEVVWDEEYNEFDDEEDDEEENEEEEIDQLDDRGEVSNMNILS
jgi:hypothetical protein